MKNTAESSVPLDIIIDNQQAVSVREKFLYPRENLLDEFFFGVDHCDCDKSGLMDVVEIDFADRDIEFVPDALDDTFKAMPFFLERIASGKT